MIPPKKSTVINRLELNSGTYIITGYALYTTEFQESAIYTLSRNGAGLVTCRGNGIGGGGMTPFTILKTIDSVRIELVVWQGSTSDKSISNNTLTALKIA